ncbi:class I SAM-dependent methyltransferase [Streptomyces luteogriseus]|uniref:class I SAM-dependent methyltransferase n=1 Tax=Streptomyces luteogriseus TaxID=68233 RepID=UPI00261ACD45|nr:class I SAM-dependent methyltransferase [uncultured Streptomyces sp.]
MTDAADFVNDTPDSMADAPDSVAADAPAFVTGAPDSVAADAPDSVPDAPHPVAADAPDFVTETRVFYDTVAEEYAVQFGDLRPGTPLDRGVLHGFAELVGEGGEVADLGCGPGRVTAYLASQGLSVFGLDVSESMLAIARRENPGLRFVRGSMQEPELPDGSLDGVVSWYSIIHTPEEHLPALFAVFHRVLRPGGHLLLGFQSGDEPRRYEEAFGHQVSLTFRRRRPERIAALLGDAGFTVRATTVREPDEAQGEPVAQASLVARKAGE